MSYNNKSAWMKNQQYIESLWITYHKSITCKIQYQYFGLHYSTEEQYFPYLLSCMYIAIAQYYNSLWWLYYHLGVILW